MLPLSRAVWHLQPLTTMFLPCLKQFLIYNSLTEASIYNVLFLQGTFLVSPGMLTFSLSRV